MIMISALTAICFFRRVVLYVTFWFRYFTGSYLIWYQGNACSFWLYLSSSCFPALPLRPINIFRVKNFFTIRFRLLSLCGGNVIFSRLTSKLIFLSNATRSEAELPL